MPTGITITDPKELKERVAEYQKQGYKVHVTKGQLRTGEPVWVVSIYETMKMAGRPAPTNLAELYAAEEVKVQRAMAVTPKERKKLRKVKPEEAEKKLAEYKRRGFARIEAEAFMEKLKQQEATAKEVGGQMAERLPLVERVIEKTKQRFPYATSVARTGVEAGKKAVVRAKEVTAEELAPKKILERTKVSMARQASMRKVIPVSAQMAQKQGRDYTYLARIGKVAAPAISETSYPAQETIAEAPPQYRLAQIPMRSNTEGTAIAEAPARASIAFKPRTPKIAGGIGVKSAGNIGDMPYLKRKKEEESEEPSSD